MAARGLDFIKDLNPSKEQWRIKVRVIRLWKQKNFRQPKLGDNIEMLLLDELGGRIQATLRPSLRFKDAFNEGQVYTISNFGVSLNEDPFKPTTHQYKIVFNPRTAQSLVNDSYIPHYGFSFIEFDKILKETRENAFLVDVIGMLSVVVERKELTKNGSPLHMISFELDDLSGNKVRCTLWENFADEMCSVVDKNLNEPVIFVIQFAKIKSWKGVMGISNTMFNTKIFINNYDIPEVLAFKKRIPAGEGLHVEKLSTTNSGTSSLDDVLLSTLRKTIVEIKESREIMTCLTLAEIMCIESTHNWFYKSYYNCTNGVEHDFGIWYCKKCDKGWSSPRLRYCIKVRVVDGTDAASLILFDSAAMGFLNISASDLRELHLKRVISLLPSVFIFYINCLPAVA